MWSVNLLEVCMWIYTEFFSEFPCFLLNFYKFVKPSIGHSLSIFTCLIDFCNVPGSSRFPVNTNWLTSFISLPSTTTCFPQIVLFLIILDIEISTPAIFFSLCSIITVIYYLYSLYIQGDIRYSQNKIYEINDSFFVFCIKSVRYTLLLCISYIIHFYVLTPMFIVDISTSCVERCWTLSPQASLSPGAYWKW